MWPAPGPGSSGTSTPSGAADEGVGRRRPQRGRPHLAAQALQAGLVDECHLFLNPVVVGGGNPALPDNLRLELELLDERRFANGVVYLRYRESGHYRARRARGVAGGVGTSGRGAGGLISSRRR